MSFLERIIEFFKNLIAAGSPESLKKQRLRKIEADLRSLCPNLYKNGELLPIAGEAFFLLYKHTSPLHKILSFMGENEDLRLKNRMYDILIETGYSERSGLMLEALNYESRKKKLEQAQSEQRESESQRHIFDELMRDLQTPAFAAIEQTLKNLALLYDLCSFSFISILRQFNSSFDPIDMENIFAAAPLDKLEKPLTELYAVTANLELNGALARAISGIGTALGKKDKAYSPEEISANLKKIAAVLKQVFSPEILKNCILLAKKDPDFQVQAEADKTAVLNEYAERAKTRFKAEEQRLRSELRDQELSRDIKQVFGTHPLLTLQGYSAENNAVLQEGSAASFLWINPLQIIKTFLHYFFEDQVMGLLTDVVLEGFFNSAEHKTQFSAALFACTDIERHLEEFEKSFARGGKNDILLVLSYVRDSKKDAEFSRTLTNMVSAINLEAKNFIQTQVSYLYDLYKLIVQLSEDAKKSSPETVSNIKFLFTSSRNRERVEFLEKSLPAWADFLKIMKNYALIGQVNTSREETRQGLAKL